MRKIVAAILLCGLALTANAVPARRGWQTRTQPDGTPIEVQQIGDEFYHYWMTKDGKIAEMQDDGTFIATDQQQPTAEQVMALRKASKRYVNRAKKIGANSMPARGLFILVNFSDESFSSASESYYKTSLGDQTEGAKSMYNYLKLQSNGKYTPPIDVFGPVTLSKTVSYYGSNDSSGDDKHPAEMVVEACKALDSQIDFSQYDANGDNTVDNVYIIYAGKGEADGGAKTTIWPHQWDIYSAERLTCKLDGKNIKTYACSAELNGSDKYAMGTPLHEFSHVLGLPDYYDTEYESTNYTEGRTPNEWSLMDGGSYNDDGKTPPNYSIFDKYFLGWDTPKLLAKDAKLNVTLTTDYGDAYQINGGSTLLAATNTNTIYYIENRQKTGWDAALPGHGMIVWRVMYNESKWENNELNNEDGVTRYTVVSASGDQTEIGKASDPFPGTKSTKTYTPFTGCALTEIAESNGNITFKYNGGQAKTECTYEFINEHCTVPEDGVIAANAALSLIITPEAGYILNDASCWTVEMGNKNELVYGEGFTYNATTNEFRIEKVTDDVTILVEGKKSFQLTWMANGVEFGKTTTAGTVVLPATDPDIDCGDKVFVGWCDQANYSSETTAPTFVKNGDAVEAAKTFYAVFAVEGEGGAKADSTSFDFAKIAAANGWEDSKAYTTVTIDPVTITAQGGGNNGKWYESNKGSWRMYNEGTVHIEVANGNITFVASAPQCDWDYSNGVATFSPSTTTKYTGIVVHYTIEGAGPAYTDFSTTCTAPEPVYYTIRFFNNGTQIGEDQSVLRGQQAQKPADPTPACNDYTFVGWWTEALAAENTDAKTWITNFKATKDQDYYAIFSKTVESAGGASASVTFKNAATDSNVDASSTAGNIRKNIVDEESGIASYSGSKVFAGTYGAKLGANSSVGKLTITLSEAVSTNTITVDAKQYNTDGGSLEITVNDGTAFGTSKKPSAEGGLLTFTGDVTTISSVTIATSSKRAYVKAVTIGTGSSSTTYYSSFENCQATGMEQKAVEQTAIKAIRDGQLVIIRGNEIYNVTGIRIQ